jgi:hypothetical protein
VASPLKHILEYLALDNLHPDDGGVFVFEGDHSLPKPSSVLREKKVCVFQNHFKTIDCKYKKTKG